MTRLMWAGLLAASTLLPVSRGQGTTVSIGLSYCATSGTAVSPQVTTGPDAPYYLYVTGTNGGPSQYVDATGRLTDITRATQFIVTDEGRLSAEHGFISTNASVPSQPFAIAPNIQIISTEFRAEYGLLRWTNNAFPSGEASFCVSGNTVTVLFDEILPSGCRHISLSLVLVSQLLNQSVPSWTTRSVVVSQSTTSLSTTLQSNSNPRSTPTYVSSTASSITDASFPAPSTIGTPNCLERSVYDGTVNGGYLILCATTLTGSELLRENTTSFSSCINQCTNYESASDNLCVAIEYDTTDIFANCHLFSAIQPVVRGSNVSVNAAILVTSSNAPPISFISATATTTVTTTTSTIVTESTSVSLVTPPISAYSSTNAHDSSLSSLSLTIQSSDSTTPTIVVTSTSTSTAAITTTTASTRLSTIAKTTTTLLVGLSTSMSSLTTTILLSSATATTTTTLQATMSTCPSIPLTSSLCPQENNAVLDLSGDDTCYGVLCSTTLTGTVVTANSTVANNLRACAGFCSLYNDAIPYACLGVNYLGSTVASGQKNCFLYTEVLGETRGTPGIDSIRLIYAGYPYLQK